jgi:hypothetical protein
MLDEGLVKNKAVYVALALNPDGVSAPTAFSPKSNGPNVDIQRGVERWVELSRSRAPVLSM